MINSHNVHAIGFGTLLPEHSNINGNRCFLATMLMRISFMLLSKHMKLPYSYEPYKNSKEFFVAVWLEYYPEKESKKEQVQYALSCIKESVNLSFTYTIIEHLPFWKTLYSIKKILGIIR